MGEIPDFVACQKDDKSCKHCSECLLKLVKENIEAKKPAFCCGKECNCLLNVPQVNGGMEFFQKNLDVSKEKLNEMVVSNYCELALKPWRLLSDKLLAEPKRIHSFESQNSRLGGIDISLAPFTDVHREEKKELYGRMVAMVKMTRCKIQFPALDKAVDILIDAIKSRTKDEDMLAKCNGLVNPIRTLLQNRANLDEDVDKYIPDMLGMTMLDIVNMKLQRAKDALTTAYSIARTCKICTSTCKYDEEQLVTLHSGLDTDVKEWKWNGSYGQHRNRSAFRLPCFACKDCFTNYLKFKSSLGKPALKCPGMNCECFLKESDVKAIAPVAYADYQAAIMRFALKRVKNYRTCPNSCCSAGLVLDIDCNVEKISCTACNFEFCPHCNDLPHEGKTCDEMRRQRHAERWGDSKDFMENETKQCPFCLAWIEKNGGCNHMTCHHCRGEFCWLCFGDWKTHQDCEHKEAVVRRPFNELYPDWLRKPKKKILPRFSVGKHVSFECKSSFQTKIARVVEVVEALPGMYLVEPVNGSFDNPLRIEESQLRGYNEILPDVVRFGEASIANEEAAYASFLEGFESGSEEENDDGCKGPCACSTKKKPLAIVVEDAFPPNETIGQSLQIPFDGEYHPGSLEMSKEVSELSFVQQRMRRARLAKLRHHRLRQLDDSEEEESSFSIDAHFPHSCDEDDESCCSSSVAFWFPSSESESESEDSDAVDATAMFGSDSSCGFDSDDEESSS